MAINPYGLHNLPAVGGGVPGLPRRDPGRPGLASLPRLSGFRKIISYSDDERLSTPPEWARFMRVVLTGPGGRGIAQLSRDETISIAIGGAGAGCAATHLVPASEILYFLGARETVSGGTNATESYALFAGRELRATPGGSPRLNNNSQSTVVTSSLRGGQGYGGDTNFAGGDAVDGRGSQGANRIVTSSGAGAAGPGGIGADGRAFTTTGTTQISSVSDNGLPGDLDMGGTGWAFGGGDSGCTAIFLDRGTSYRKAIATGGAGAGAAAGIAIGAAEYASGFRVGTGLTPGNPSPSHVLDGAGSAGVAGAGGAGGGGGAAVRLLTSSFVGGAGVAAIYVEFYR